MAHLLSTTARWGRLLAAAILAGGLAGILLGVGGARSQTPPAAPTITSVTPGDGGLDVVWTAPGGVTGITGYDLRYIRTDSDAADKMDDGKWAEKHYSWSSGDPLEYTLDGLAGGVGYDVQLRAVTSVDGDWSSTVTGTPRDPPPVIALTVEGDEALTVYWTVPLGVDESEVTAYDLRYIETDATDKADGNWTGPDEVWSAGDGSRRYLLTGLDNGKSYDVQVRAVTTVDGPWSVTATGTPSEPGDSRSSAVSLPRNARIGGVIDPGNDEDYFSITLNEATGIIIFTIGDLDTVGELQNSSGTVLDSNDDSLASHGPWNFLIWHTLPAGTHYIKVTSFGSATGEYVLQTITITDSTATTDATPLDLNVLRNGIIDPRGDQDYFEFTLDERSDVIIRSSGTFDTVGEVLDDEGTLVAYNDDGHLSGLHFLIRALLDAGTYYVRVTGYPLTIFTNTGVYSVRVETVAEPGSTLGTAVSLDFGRAQGGRISPASDVDYFRIDLTENKWVELRAVSETVDIEGDLLDSGGSSVDVNLYEWEIEEEDENGDEEEVAWGFTLSDLLPAGTYYIKITRDGPGVSTTGPYTVRMFEDVEYSRFINNCSGITTTISDPLYGCQWHMNNTGQLGGTDGEDINVEDAWADTQGAGITVAVVDNGMDYEHEDLADNVITGRNHDYTTGGNDIFDTRYSHGTAVAGVVAARDNNVGVRGVAPRAGIYGYNLLRALTDMNQGDAMTRNMATTAVSNNSWGWPDGAGPDAAPTIWESAIERGIESGYGGKGVLYVWAAGNGALRGDDSNLDGHANHYSVTAVCAVNDQGERSVYSEQGANLWVCGPSDDHTGEGITTTDNADRYMDDFGGTSSATPAVSGVAALVRATESDLTWRDTKLILAASARKNDRDNTSWQQGAFKYGSDTDRYHFSHEYGFGVVDADAAVDLAADWDLLPALLEETATSEGRPVTIPDNRRRVSSSITVGSTMEFTEFVEVNATFNAPDFRDLEVALVSPSGAVSLLSPALPTGAVRTEYCVNRGVCGLVGSFRFGSARHLGENPAGTWILRVTDKVSGGTASVLQIWRLTVYGHNPPSEAPRITSVTPETAGLEVEWAVPTATDESDIVAYDVRHIDAESTDAEKAVDANWTLQDDAWTSGDRKYTISGLTEENEYDVQVRAVTTGDVDGPWSGSVTAKPGMGNQAPTFDEGDSAEREVAENSAGGTKVGTPVVATDADSDSLVYDLSGTHAALFGIDVSTGQISVADSAMLDFEGPTPEYSLTVSVKDNKDAADDYDPTSDDSIAVTVRLTGVNESPEFLDPPMPAYSYAENRTLLIDSYSANDPENDSLQWSLEGTDRDDFAITQTGELSFSAPPDYEEPTDSGRNNRYDIRIAVSDGTHKATSDVIVGVTPVDEAPEVEGDTDIDHPENQGELVEGYSAEDPEGRTIAWSVSGTDSDDFAISETGELSFRAVPDYENPTDSGGNNSYLVTVQASDGTNPARIPVTVTVTNLDEEGTVDLSSPQPQVGSALEATLEDADGSVSGLTWTWERSTSRSSGWSPIAGAAARSYTPVGADLNHYLRVTAAYTDGEGTGKDAVAVSANRARTAQTGNTAPEFPTSETGQRSVAENTRAGVNVGSAVRATDPQNDRLTYRLGGADADAFSIVSTTGQIRTDDPLDREAKDEYTVTVTATDPSSLGASITVTITVADENEAPTITGDVVPRHGEHSDGTVAFYSARDPEGDPINWSLGGTDRRRFEIDAGALSFAEPPDYESPADSGRDNEYSLAVRADDGKGKTGILDVVVSVTNEDDDGAISLSSDNPLVNSPLTATLNDPDGVVIVDMWTWEHSHGSNVWIAIIDEAESATYEPTSNDEGRFLRVTARYEDTFGSFKSAEATTADVVRVGSTPPRRRPPPPPPGPSGPGGGGGGGGPAPLPPGANQPPEFSEGSRTVRSVVENSGPGVNIGGPLTAVDPEGDGLTYTLGGPNADSFDLVASSGQLLTGASLDYETRSSYTVTVGVRDSKDVEGEADRRRDDSIGVTVLVTNMDEPGEVTPSAPRPRVGRRLGAALVDPDGGVADLTWQWERSADRTAWKAIDGATTAAYTPIAADEGQYLRVVISYTDTHGGAKTATGATDAPVIAGITTEFTDVDAEGVHTPAIRALATDGVFVDTECGEGRFCPQEPIQRWVMAVWMIRLLGGEPPTAGVSRFDDVAAGQWWIRYAERLADRGITIGCTADPPQYCPDRSVTRAQMATFLVRAVDLQPAQPAGFTDTGGSVHAANIDALAAVGITVGCSADPPRYCPDRSVTRAQMATFLYRALALQRTIDQASAVRID